MTSPSLRVVGSRAANVGATLSLKYYRDNIVQRQSRYEVGNYASGFRSALPVVSAMAGGVGVSYAHLRAPRCYVLA